MADNKDNTEIRDVVRLTNELTYQKYLMNKSQVKDFFEKLSIPEYIALHNIETQSAENVIFGGRTYLKDLAQKMQITMRRTSNMVGDLRDRGLVVWAHDGNGSEGTYVTITENGKKLLREQEEILKEYYGRVIGKYGKENMIRLLQMVKELETVLSSAAEEMDNEAEEEENPLLTESSSDFPPKGECR